MTVVVYGASLLRIKSVERRSRGDAAVPIRPWYNLYGAPFDSCTVYGELYAFTVKLSRVCVRVSESHTSRSKEHD